MQPLCVIGRRGRALAAVTELRHRLLSREAHSRSVMLQHQDPHVNSAYGGPDSASSSLQNRKCDKDGNFNFLSAKEENVNVACGGEGGDENRNQVRPRSLGPLGRDPSASSPASAHHGNGGPLSPRSRLPPWSRLEPLPEVESGDDFGRFPPDGAEERRTEEEEGQGGGGGGRGEAEARRQKELQRRMLFRGPTAEARPRRGRPDDRGDYSDFQSQSDSESASASDSDCERERDSSLGPLTGGWDRVGVGEHLPRRSLSGGGVLAEVEEEEEEEEGEDAAPLRPPRDQSSDSDGEQAELMAAVWTLRDRERFKAQEMEKHQVQLTMYRRLALIRWVRTLQARVLQQQNRLQSSFDVILTHRKELLRMGAAASVAAPVAAPAASQS